jgi:PAS domain S-box-containing protein
MRFLCSIFAATAPNLFWRLLTVYWFSAHLLSAATIDGVPLKPIKSERFQALDSTDFSVVACFEQDSFGFVWIGTKDGLICFDGYETKHYVSHSGDGGSLTDNSVTTILEAPVPGDLWVLTENGILHYMDRERERFELCQPEPDPLLDWQTEQEIYIDKIYQGPGGDLWVSSSTGMIYLLDDESKSFHRIGSGGFSGDSLLLDEPKKVVEMVWEPSRPERLVVITHQKGLMVLDLVQKTAVLQSVQLEDVSDTSRRIYSGVGNGDGQIWLLMDNRAVILWDPDLDQWMPIPVLGAAGVQGDGALDGDVIFCELSDDGALWFGYQNLYNALTRFDPVTQEFDHFYLAGNNPQDFTRPSCGFFDREGMLWVGGNRGDIYMVRPPQPGVVDWRDHLQSPLPHAFDVQALMEDRDGALWVGTSINGLYSIDQSTHAVKHWPSGDGVSGGLKIDDILSLFQDLDGAIWIGTNGAGLHRLDPAADQWRWYDPDTSSSTLKSGRRIRDMLRDSFGQFWVATKDGLKLLDTETGGFEVFKNEPKDSLSISNNSIRNLYEDSNGVLWVATDNGLNRYHRETGQFTRYLADPSDPAKISSGLVRCMLEDGAGRFWVGTRNGLNLMDRVKGKFQIFDAHASGFSSVFLSLVEDPSGRVWAGTGQGLLRIEFSPWTVLLLNQNDGLVNTHYEPGAAIVDRLGNLVFGGKSGLDMVAPSAFSGESTSVATVTKMVVSGQTHHFGELHRWKKDTTPKVFEWNQHDVEFYFSSLRFSGVNHSKYRWRLVGFSDKWEGPSSKTSMRYANLAPGNYQFEVASTKDSGELDMIEPSIRFIIRAPFWVTGSFRLLVLLLLGTVLLGGYRLRVRRISKSHRLLEKRIQERTRELDLSDRALNAASNGIVISESDSASIIHVNRTFLEMFGFSQEEIIGKDLEILLGPESDSADVTVLKKAIHSDSETGVTLLAYRKDGCSIWCEIKVAPVSDGAGALTHRIWTMTDVTSVHQHEKTLREARDDAEAANKAQSEFLSRMSHELRTPLNSILGFSKLLKMAPMGTRELSNIDRIHRAGKHLLNLINDVLDIERIQSEQLHFSPNGVLVMPLLREGIDMLSPLASDFQAAVVLDVACPGDSRVVADGRRLQQVFMNLISNGIKYNRVGGTLYIRCQKTESDRLEIHFNDEGNGIPKEKMDRLFVPFDRLGAEQRSQIEGTGLGLALSKKLIEAMGGSIEVQSEPGIGTTFSVGLKMISRSKMETSVKTDTSIVERKDVLNFDQTKILYIEDNEDNLSLVKQLLELRPNVRLMSTAYGNKGIQMADKSHPDLILLDLNLPDMNGDEVVEILKKQPSTQDIPICILSADAQPSQITRLKSMGVADYLVKPLDIAQFLAVIDQLASSGKSSGAAEGTP